MSSDPETTDRRATVDGPDTPSGSPLDAFLEEGLGFPLADIGLAVERGRAEATERCMRNRGWDYDEPKPERFDPSSIARSTAAENARRALTAGPGTSSDTSDETLPDEYYADVSACRQEAAREVPSPVDAAWSWLANESGDLNRQVTADPRVVDATEAFTRCLADAGYDTTSYDEVFSPFSDRAARIGEEVRSGSLDLDTALVELDTLHAEELAAREAVDGPCLAPLQTVQGEVMAEMESAWLESNAPRLTELRSHLSDDVARLSAELDEIAEEES